MLIDYHLHNHFSPDSDADTRELLEAERKRGVHEIMMTNHAEWFDNGKAKPGIFDYYEAMRRFETIKWELDNLKDEFPELNVGLGVELQYQEEHMDDLARFVKDTPLDFILGSIHIIDGVVISTKKYKDDIFPNIKEDDAWEKYFEDMLKLIEWGHLDVLTHFDIVKKYGHEYYGPFKPEKYKSMIQNVLKKAIDKGMGLELNTGSLHKRCEELFPHPTILKWALELGMEHFTLSSDAHSPARAGEFVHEALEIAKEVGIPTISTYEKRKPTKHKI
jgi:histidinol-phosphatase (PHP family)